ncbi:MAG TPA: hypothetical protein VFV99_32080 [Kofleriaceae bacterium]|nr:hypothetical protein [Kofleriaceae bacterium]
MKSAVLASVLFCAACSSALKEPSPIATYAPGHADGRTANELVAAANAAWAHRGEAGKAEAAQGLYLDAAVVDPHRFDAIAGAMRAISYRIENEQHVAREKLAKISVELGQLCQRRAPKQPECDYRLAIALGQYARENTASAKDAVNRMVGLLHRAIAAAPRLDAGGPHRVLAYLLLRAPGWPLGPGDEEAGLVQARAAVQLAPNAENELVLGEALAKNGHPNEARAAYAKAAELATAAHEAGEPEAARWLAQARAGLAKNSG